MDPFIWWTAGAILLLLLMSAFFSGSETALTAVSRGSLHRLKDKGDPAAERALAPGGVLAVVTFHSLEDRIVKRFFRDRTGRAPKGSRYEPEVNLSAPSFETMNGGDVAPTAAEIDANPRARSARLRAARRTEAPAQPVDPQALGLPTVERRPQRGSARRRRR